MPSVRSASRQVLTVPGYTCLAPLEGAVRCHAIDARPYTWGSTAANAFGMRFAPLTGASFALPQSLWLAPQTSKDGRSFRALATFGLGSIVALSGADLHAVEVRPAAQCQGGELRLVHRRVDAELTELDSRHLGCANTQDFGDSDV